ncbi:octopamine receptor beta-1R-like [Limulus polyphemus]|uniref:Octopamine receptor beta-1R-like n=1 Tax=Limulus polyphemus TaxID=6850 RepID=A0ABM1SLH3_LIMPO|nr:octopamine receptor beta-1R-like [Limulus polyphemus]XP_022244480.1 octopamine receptor beta-1R-like [Limulus polyphemus]XP_022244481.1 octopamine receptor beta-1R-like [Limulus polyphemus]
MRRQITEDDRDFASSVVAAAFTITITCLSLLGNITVIVVARTDSELKLHVSNLLIVNLAVTDLLTSLLVMIPSITTLIYDRWILGTALCKLHCTLNYCFIIVSMLSLSLITIDRAVAVKHPLRYAQIMTTCRIGFMIGYAWLQGLAFALIPSVYNWVHFDYWEAVCAIKWEVNLPIIAYVVIAFLCCFIIPAGIIVFYNTTILWSAQKMKHNTILPKLLQTKTAKGSERIRGASGSNDRCQSVGLARQKIARSIIVIIFVFLLCMTPFCLIKLLKVLLGAEAIPTWANLFSTIIQFTASATNPFIYAIFRRDFRYALKRLPRRLFGL